MAPSEETSQQQQQQQQTSGGDSAASENVTASRDVWIEENIHSAKSEEHDAERQEKLGEEIAALVNDLCEKVVALAVKEEEDVREKCKQLLQELVSQAEVSPTTMVHRSAGQTVCCKLPLTKVSIALQLYLGRSLPLAPPTASNSTNNTEQETGTVASVQASQAAKPVGPILMPLCPKTPQADEQPPSSPLVPSSSTPYLSSLALPRRFLFQVEQVHQMVLSDGQKLFACDICSGVYQRSFSLKRHYLRTHINHRYLTERDMSNCGIVPSDRLAKEAKRDSGMGMDGVAIQCEDLNVSKNEESSEQNENELFPGLYRCHMCSVFLDSKEDLIHHLNNHKPIPINVPAPRSKSVPSGSDSGEDTQLLCSYCDKTFSTVTMRKRHVSRSHPNAAAPETKLQHHKCAYCTSSPVQVFRELPHLVQHLVATHSDVYHACACCKLQFDSSTLLEQHVKTFHPDILHFCTHCAIQFESKAMLDKHVKASHANMFHCDSQVLLDQHMIGTHPEQLHMCNFCPLQFSSKAMLDQHLLIAHSNLSNHCIPCNLNFDSRLLFDLHVNTKHLEQLQTCSQNVLQFDSRAVLDKQLQAACSPIYLLCAHCGLYFDNKSAHNGHISSVHPDLYHPCSQCELNFYSRSLLDQHLKVVHPNEQHACKWCSQCFESKSALNEHTDAVHNACTRCDLDFETKILLNEHIKVSHNVGSIHKNSLEHQTCEKSSHTQIISGVSNGGTAVGEFLYSCSMCHQVFNDYVAMCRHHRLAHKGKRTLSTLMRSNSTDSKGQSGDASSKQKHDKPSLVELAAKSLPGSPVSVSQANNLPVTNSVSAEERFLLNEQKINAADSANQQHKEAKSVNVIDLCNKSDNLVEIVNEDISLNENDSHCRSQKQIKETKHLTKTVSSNNICNQSGKTIVNTLNMNEQDAASNIKSKPGASDFTVQLPLNRISNTAGFQGIYSHSSASVSTNFESKNDLNLNSVKNHTGKIEQNRSFSSMNFGTASKSNNFPENSLEQNHENCDTSNSVNTSQNMCPTIVCEKMKLLNCLQNSPIQSTPKSLSDINENAKNKEDTIVEHNTLFFNNLNEASNNPVAKQETSLLNVTLTNAEHVAEALETSSNTETALVSMDESSKVLVPISKLHNSEAGSLEHTKSTSMNNVIGSDSEKVKYSLDSLSDVNVSALVLQSKSDSQIMMNECNTVIATELEWKPNSPKSALHDTEDYGSPATTVNVKINSASADADQKCLEQNNTASISCVLEDISAKMLVNAAGNDISTVDIKSKSLLLHKNKDNLPNQANGLDIAHSTDCEMLKLSSITEVLHAATEENSESNSIANPDSSKTVKLIDVLDAGKVMEIDPRTSKIKRNVIDSDYKVCCKIRSVNFKEGIVSSVCKSASTINNSVTDDYECKVTSNESSGTDASRIENKKQELNRITKNGSTLSCNLMNAPYNVNSKHCLRKFSRRHSFQMKHGTENTNFQLRRSSSSPIGVDADEGCDFVKNKISVVNTNADGMLLARRVSEKRILRSRSSSSLLRETSDITVGSGATNEEVIDDTASKEQMLTGKSLLPKAVEKINTPNLCLAEQNNEKQIDASRNICLKNEIMEIDSSQKSNNLEENVKESRTKIKKCMPKKKQLLLCKPQNRKGTEKYKNNASSGTTTVKRDTYRKGNKSQTKINVQGTLNESVMETIQTNHKGKKQNKDSMENEKNEGNLEICTSEKLANYDVSLGSKEIEIENVSKHVDTIIENLKKEDGNFSNCMKKDKEKNKNEKCGNNPGALTNKLFFNENVNCKARKEENLESAIGSLTNGETCQAVASNGIKEEQTKSETKKMRGTRLRKFSRRVQSPEECHLDPETLFYCRIEGNIRENLLHHLDGKLGSPTPIPPALMSTTVDIHTEDNHNHQHHRSPGFTKRENGQCNLAAYIKDISHLDISTQITMHQNLQRMNSTELSEKLQLAVNDVHDVVSFSQHLCLSARSVSDNKAGIVRRRSLRNRGKEALSASSAASSFTASMALRQWSSCDDVNSCGTVELSGEWVRPRNYICAACGVTFTDLWDLEDHKYAHHPNVWCTHYEFEQSSNGKRSQQEDSDLCRQLLQVHTEVKTAGVLLTNDIRCTKCDKVFGVLSDLHRHMLECGGDTTWMLLPSPGSGSRRSRKWRPFGSRRRRQQGSHRRGMKRNIPTTPIKVLGQHFHQRGSRPRVAGGDSDSIQRMLANLPPKRSTRRAIQFSEDEIKTRSQGTISSVSGTLQPYGRVAQIGSGSNHGMPVIKQRAKSAVPIQSKSAIKRMTRGGRSLSPASSSRTESPPSESRTSPTSTHRSRSRIRKPLQLVDKQHRNGLKSENVPQNTEVLDDCEKKRNKADEKEEILNRTKQKGQQSEIIPESFTLNGKLKESEIEIKQNDMKIIQGSLVDSNLETVPQQDNVKSKSFRRRKVVQNKVLDGKQKLNSLQKSTRKRNKVTKLQKSEAADHEKQEVKELNTEKSVDDQNNSVSCTEKEEFDVDIGTLAETYNILAAMRIAMLEGTVTKQFISPKANKQKNRRKSEPVATVSTEIDDKMPELQKEGPLEPVGEVFSDIPILSPAAVDEKESIADKLKSRRASLPGLLNIQSPQTEDKNFQDMKVPQEDFAERNKSKIHVLPNSEKLDTSGQLQINNTDIKDLESDSHQIISKTSINDCTHSYGGRVTESMVLKLKVKHETSKLKCATTTASLEKLKPISEENSEHNTEVSLVRVSQDKAQMPVHQEWDGFILAENSVPVQRQRRPRRRNSATPTWDRSPTKKNKKITPFKNRKILKLESSVDELKIKCSMVTCADSDMLLQNNESSGLVNDSDVSSNSLHPELPIHDKNMLPSSKKKSAKNKRNKLNLKTNGRNHHDKCEESEIFAGVNILSSENIENTYTSTLLLEDITSVSSNDFKETKSNTIQPDIPTNSLSEKQTQDHILSTVTVVCRENKDSEIVKQDEQDCKTNTADKSCITNNPFESEAIENVKVLNNTSKNEKKQSKRKKTSGIKSKVLKIAGETRTTVDSVETKELSREQAQLQKDDKYHTEQNAFIVTLPSNESELVSVKTARRRNAPKCKIVEEKLTKFPALLLEEANSEVHNLTAEISQIKSQSTENNLLMKNISVLGSEKDTYGSKRNVSKTRKSVALDNLPLKENLSVEMENDLGHTGLISSSRKTEQKNRRGRKKCKTLFNDKVEENIYKEAALLANNSDLELGHNSVRDKIHTKKLNIFSEEKDYISPFENSLNVANDKDPFQDNNVMLEVTKTEENGATTDSSNKTIETELVVMNKGKIEDRNIKVLSPNELCPKNDNLLSFENGKFEAMNQSGKEINDRHKEKKAYRKNKRIEAKLEKQLLKESKHFYMLIDENPVAAKNKSSKIREAAQLIGSANNSDVNKLSAENKVEINSAEIVCGGNKKMKLKVQIKQNTENKGKTAVLIPDYLNGRLSLKNKNLCPYPVDKKIINAEKYVSGKDKDNAGIKKRGRKRKVDKKKSTKVLSPGDEDSSDDLPISKLKEVIQLQQITTSGENLFVAAPKENHCREAHNMPFIPVMDYCQSLKDIVTNNLSEHGDNLLAKDTFPEPTLTHVQEQQKYELLKDTECHQLHRGQNMVDLEAAGFKDLIDNMKIDSFSKSDFNLEVNTHNESNVKLGSQDGKSIANERNVIELMDTVLIEENAADSHDVNSVSFNNNILITKDNQIVKAKVPERNTEDSNSAHIKSHNNGIQESLTEYNKMNTCKEVSEKACLDFNTKHHSSCIEKNGNDADSFIVEETIPMRQARRTRCNTSYEEVYTWSDVTSETEDSSQDFPVIQEFPHEFEKLSECLPSPPYLPVDAIKSRKKRKLHNNSRQYRNGRLVRRRKRKQKKLQVRTKLQSSRKPSRVNEFIVTDIETGQEESQDSICSSTLKAITNEEPGLMNIGMVENEVQGLKSEQLVDALKKKMKILNKKLKSSDSLSKHPLKASKGFMKSSPKRKRKRNFAIVEGNNKGPKELKLDLNVEGTNKLNEDYGKQISECNNSELVSLGASETGNSSIEQNSKVRRKSSAGSLFFCSLCKKYYSTNYNLMKHKKSRLHQKREERTEKTHLSQSKESDQYESNMSSSFSLKNANENKEKVSSLENPSVKSLELKSKEIVQSEKQVEEKATDISIMSQNSNSSYDSQLVNESTSNEATRELLNVGETVIPQKENGKNVIHVEHFQNSATDTETLAQVDSVVEVVNDKVMDILENTQLEEPTKCEKLALKIPPLESIPNSTEMPYDDSLVTDAFSCSEKYKLVDKQCASGNLTQENALISDKSLLESCLSNSAVHELKEFESCRAAHMHSPLSQDLLSSVGSTMKDSSNANKLRSKPYISNNKILEEAANIDCTVDQEDSNVHSLPELSHSEKPLFEELDNLKMSTLEDNYEKSDSEAVLNPNISLQQEQPGIEALSSADMPSDTGNVSMVECETAILQSEKPSSELLVLNLQSLEKATVEIESDQNEPFAKNPQQNITEQPPNWPEEQGTAWSYGGNWPLQSWSAQDAEGQWTADASQDGSAHFFPSTAASLGSILDSVNQILDNEEHVEELDYQPYMMDLLPYAKTAEEGEGLKELQQAMGATDEEMAMLQQLGESNCWNLEEADIMDLDSQKTSSLADKETNENEQQKHPAEGQQQHTESSSSLASESLLQEASSSSLAKRLLTDATPQQCGTEKRTPVVLSTRRGSSDMMERVITGRGGLRNQDMLLSPYENKDMVCPVCSRWYVGLSALRAHLSVAHNSSTRSHSQAVVKRSRFVTTQNAGGTIAARHVCQVCKELLPDEQGLAKHVDVAHVDRGHLGRIVHEQRHEGLSTNSSVGDQGLRTHMSTALGGLLTRALNKVLGNAARGIHSPLTSSGTSSSPGSPLAQPAVQSCSNEPQQFACPKCAERFATETLRDQHISAVHAVIRRSSTDSLSSQDEGKEKSSGIKLQLEKSREDNEEKEEEEEARTSVSPSPQVLPSMATATATSPAVAQLSLQIDKRTSCKKEQDIKSDGLDKKSEDAASIRAKAVAALKELSTRDRRGCSAAGKKSKEDRFRFPLVRKFPPSTNRFASLAEKKKKISSSCKPKTTNDSSVFKINETRSQLKGLDVYDFEDEMEKVEPMAKRIVTCSNAATPKPVVQKKEDIALVNEPKKKRRRWNRIIVDSGDDTSDAETIISILDSGAKRKCSLRSEEIVKKTHASTAIDISSTATKITTPVISSKGGYHKRHRTAGIVVEERKPRTKPISTRRPKRSTKTDLLMSVFAKSRSKLVGRPQLYRDDSSDSSRNISPARTNSDDEKPRRKSTA